MFLCCRIIKYVNGGDKFDIKKSKNEFKVIKILLI